MMNLLIYLTYQNSLITEYPDYLSRLSSALSSFFPKTFLGTCVSLYSCFTLRTFKHSPITSNSFVETESLPFLRDLANQPNPHTKLKNAI